MTDAELAALFAIGLAKRRGLDEIGPDEMLLGCLQTRSQFGIAELGPWTFDLETLGIDWLAEPGERNTKVSYSGRAVEIFDRAARIMKADGAPVMRASHLLAAFGPEEEGLMGELKRGHGITDATWRAALAGDHRAPREQPQPATENAAGAREYLTPEEAAETLGVHVQTLRAYVRSGKLPALRLAGERAIRIRRADLEKVLEPVQPEKQT